METSLKDVGRVKRDGNYVAAMKISHDGGALYKPIVIDGEYVSWPLWNKCVDEVRKENGRHRSTATNIVKVLTPSAEASVQNKPVRRSLPTSEAARKACAAGCKGHRRCRHAAKGGSRRRG